jgi:phenylacetate-CoA ligase
LNKKLNKSLYILIQRLRREPVLKCLKELLKSQWFSLDQLEELQLEKIRAVIKEAYDHVPFYRDLYDRHGISIEKIQSLHDVSMLPMIGKEDMRNNFPELINKNYQAPFDYYSTSGSSGNPLALLKSRMAGAYGRAALYRGHQWHGIEIGEREFRIGGFFIDKSTHRKQRLIDFLMNRRRVSSFDLSTSTLKEFCQLIDRYQPDYLFGYPSAIYRLACFMEEHHIKLKTDINRIITSSEVLYPYRREKISSVLGCPVINEYGCAEASILAYDCPNGSLHQTMENVFIELLSDRQLSAQEDLGEVVITDLNNLKMPLIRYKLGDIARFLPIQCRCGRELRVMDVKEGSTFGTIELSAGRIISGVHFYFISEHLLTKKDSGIREFRIYRKGSCFSVKVVKKENYGERHGEELMKELKSVLGEEAEITIEFVDRIDAFGADKFKILIQED